MSLKLKSITFDNLGQVSVVPSASNLDRSYGRRFTVTIGDESKDVVLKDLYKRAQKLTKKATSASELNDVNSFIAKLENAETAAAKIYKDRDDCVYKFRSWFHRFFGGTFLGSHMDRLDKLKSKVSGKQTDLIDSYKDYFKNRKPIFQSIINNEFEIKVGDNTYAVKVRDLTLQVQEIGKDGSILILNIANDDECSIEYEGADGELVIMLGQIARQFELEELRRQEILKALTLVKSLVCQDGGNPISLTFEGKEYLVSGQNLLGKTSIDIQELEYLGSQAGLLSIGTSQAGMEEFTFEGEEVPFIPELSMPLFNAIVIEAYKLSSNYSGYSKLNVVREGLKNIPEWHLNELIKRLEDSKILKVRFIDEALQGDAGTDLGGLKRDYIATLVESLQGSKSLFTAAEGSLKLPRIVRGDEKEPVLDCNEDEKKTYNNLGKLFYECYTSKDKDRYGYGGYEEDLITTGSFFSEGLFKAALSLKKSNFNDKQEAYVKIAKALLTHLDTEGTPYIKNYINFLNVTSYYLETFLNDKNALDEAVMFAGYDYYTNDDGDADIEKIKSDPEKFIKELREGIFKDSKLVKSLNGVSLGAMLDPIYQISLGMNQSAAVAWNALIAQDPVKVSDQIQGSIDRQKIVAMISCDSYRPTVKMKATWLKDWIENDATDDEIKTFLKFVTGGASLPEGKKLKVDEQGIDQPFPTVCTCGLGISLSSKTSYRDWKKDLWDDTKEQFIRNLKQAMVVEGFQNS